MKHIISTLIINLFILMNIYATSKNSYEFQYITLKEGLSHADANTIAFDNKGFLWIGTYSGLNRFDGIHVKSYNYIKGDGNDPFINRISTIDINENGTIWIGSANGIYSFNPEKEVFTNYKINIQEPISDIKKIITQGDYIYILGNNRKIYLLKINDKQKELSPIHFNFDKPYLNTIYKGNDNIVWFQCTKGLKGLKTDLSFTELLLSEISKENLDCIHISENKALIAVRNRILLFNISDGYLKIIFDKKLDEASIITDIKADMDGNYWVASQNGLYKLNINDFSIEHIQTKSGLFKLKSNHINQLLINDNILFLATYAGGVNYTNLKPFLKTVYQSNDEKFNFIGETIRGIIEYNNYIIIGTHTNGITILDKTTHDLIHNFNTENIIRDNNIRSIIIDNNYLWIAHGKGIEIINLETNKNITNRILKQDINIPTEFLALDIYNNIWGFGRNGLFVLIKENDRFAPTFFTKDSNRELLNNNGCVFLSSDHTRPELYLSNKIGLSRILINKNGEINNIISYKHEDNNIHTLKSNFICSAYRENDSILWVGHIGDALSKITILKDNKYRAENFPINKDYKFNDFEEIIADNYGNLWIGGNGLAIFNINDKKYNLLSTGENSFINSYKLKSGYRGKDGYIYMGGNNGFTIIPPIKFNNTNNNVKPEITDLYINNKTIKIDKNISYLSEITLKHYENNITFHCSAMNYMYASGCKIRYKLTPVDINFNTNKNASIPINYINLTPGAYHLEILASNNNDFWNPVPRKIKITILPPWWLSIPSKIVYVILVLLCLYMIYRYLMRLNNLKHQVEIQKIEQEQADKINKMQLQLFTNISHELRSPLSLILGIEEQIRTQTNNIHTINLLQVLHKNTNRLLQLINELMDFRKAKTNSFELKVQSFDCNSFINSLAKEFNNLAEHNKINYKIITPQLPIKVYADPVLLEKIVLNLLNNAFKYCNEGYIEIELSDNIDLNNNVLKNKTQILSGYNAKRYFYIRIKDTGIGISKESIEKVFERYYQIEDSEHDQHLGSGVGLALVKELVLLHKGKLYLYSERNKGCEFILCLPADSNDYTPDEIRIQEKEISLSSVNTEHLKKHKSLSYKNDKQNNTLPLLLIVEDNPEIQSFLYNNLSQQYNTITANDGQEAINLLKGNTPDIILSDLMMPVMDGIQLCTYIKNDSHFCDIPFILLTGKDTTQAMEESIKCGADVFLQKPTSLEIIHNTIKNQLSRSSRTQQRISQNFAKVALDSRLTQEEKELANRIIEIIKGNISDTELDATTISKHLGISRSGLYQKSKNLFSVSIIELVRDIRLTKAQQLMCEGNYSMSEIATMVGFLNQSYFTASFKKKYNITPTQYIKDLKSTN